MPSRRTIIVLVSLLASMTFSSAMLSWMEPGPAAPLLGISLSNPGMTPQTEDVLFETSPTPQSSRWSHLQVHFSGTAYGSARTLHAEHEQAGIGGLGYHFVIGNGRGAVDGHITVGFRWRRQLDGLSPIDIAAACHPESSSAAGRPVIDICLIGDGQTSEPTSAQVRELVWLVQQLQARLDISSSEVTVNDPSPQAPSRFPMAMFRKQLLAAAP